MHQVERYANNRIEADHNLLKHRLRPMRGLRIDRTTQVIITGLAFMQNLRPANPPICATLTACRVTACHPTGTRAQPPQPRMVAAIHERAGPDGDRLLRHWPPTECRFRFEAASTQPAEAYARRNA